MRVTILYVHAQLTKESISNKTDSNWIIIIEAIEAGWSIITSVTQYTVQQ